LKYKFLKKPQNKKDGLSGCQYLFSREPDFYRKKIENVFIGLQKRVVEKIQRKKKIANNLSTVYPQPCQSPFCRYGR